MNGDEVLTQCGLACQCNPGWGGLLCDRLVTSCPKSIVGVDPCTSSPCQNGATCVCQNSSATTLQFKCDCTADSYSGNLCETRSDMCNSMSDNVDQCDAKPCLNGGTCQDLCYDFNCKCPAGYQGKSCQNRFYDSDPCSSSPCQHGGICTAASPTFDNQFASYQCICSDDDRVAGKDWFGPKCAGAAQARGAS